VAFAGLRFSVPASWPVQREGGLKGSAQHLGESTTVS
jgi:hypothetical protein